ncbi:DsbA family protein [Novosphingobium sp.]|uniref:DsbA family protein n=1 Tax=Novosphingobium sp. TaxID=1874826 RepID=UPI003B52AE03
MSMTNPIRPLITLAAVLLAIAGLPPAHAQADDEAATWNEAPNVPPIGKLDRVYGNTDARFTLIVWLDPECPYCKVLGAQPEHVVDGSKGRVNLAERLYPLPFHGPNAMLAAATALCVADQAGVTGYYRFLDAWLAKTASNGRGIGPGAGGSTGADDPVAALAAASGARNRDALAGCTASSATAQRLAAEMHSADLAQIQGTPAVALRDNRFGHTIMVAGAVSEDDMNDAIEELAKSDDHPGASPARNQQGLPGGATH